MWNSHIHFHLLSYLFVGSKYYKEHRITATKYIHSNQPSLPLPTNTNSAVLFCFHMNVALRLESQLEALTRRINCVHANDYVGEYRQNIYLNVEKVSQTYRS